jgi:hypothetical protein
MNFSAEMPAVRKSMDELARALHYPLSREGALSEGGLTCNKRNRKLLVSALLKRLNDRAEVVRFQR